MPLLPHQILDAMPETKKEMRRRLRRSKIDFESFATPLRLCELGKCNGHCCYDGVCVDEDEEHFITAVVTAHPVFFQQLGVTPENAFEDATFLGTDTRKTTTRPFRYPKEVGHPKHFEKTTCSFRFPDGRCSLQALAMEHGEHPWAYKPLSCWLHPISLERDDKAVIWIPTKGNDLLEDPEYPGFAPYTRCGEACPGEGRPAWQTLKAELQTLGAIAERDIWGEIEAYFKAKAPAPDPEPKAKTKKA